MVAKFSSSRKRSLYDTDRTDYQARHNRNKKYKLNRKSRFVNDQKAEAEKAGPWIPIEVSENQRERKSESSQYLSESGKRTAKHFNYYIGQRIGEYRVNCHLGDGTFGRTLKCMSTYDKQFYALKII